MQCTCLHVRVSGMDDASPIWRCVWYINCSMLEVIKKYSFESSTESRYCSRPFWVIYIQMWKCFICLLIPCVSYMQWPANCSCFQGLLLEVHIRGDRCSWRREYPGILEGVRCFLCSKEQRRTVGCSHYWKYEQYMEETGKQVCKLLPELCKRKGNRGN
jgi:hypothetical protein